MFTELKAIIFDLDDTLFLERDYVKSGFQAVSHYCQHKYSLPEIHAYDFLWTKFKNGSRDKLFDQLIEEIPDLNATVGELVRLYRSHKPNIKLVDGVENLICSLRENKRIGLISDGYLDTQQNKLESLNITHLFDSVLLTDSLGKDNWKPSPVPYLKVLKDLEVSPEESVYIGDNPKKDFVFPNESGMKSIRLKYPNGVYSGLEPESEKHSPSVTVHSIKELRRVLLYD